MELRTARELDAYRQGWNKGAAYVVGAIMIGAGFICGFVEMFGSAF